MCTEYAEICPKVILLWADTVSVWIGS